MTAPTSSLIDPLPWDTDFWGVRAARVHATTPADLDEADLLAATAGVEWLSALVPANELALVNEAVRRDYVIVDVRYAMSMTLGPRAPTDPAALVNASEVDQIAQISRASLRRSRFYADRHLPDERCADFYETWARNSVGGPMADEVVVEREGSLIDGFITVKFDDDRATLSLVAVRHDRHGRGIGGRLLSSTLDWIADAGVDEVHVVTQLENAAAIALYERAGFRLDTCAIWLHKWYQ